jgi:perosamine synthetase
MDPASIESRITDRTRAIVPVHIYGMPCDMDPINAIAKKHNLAVVEDACQAWLAEYKGRSAARWRPGLLQLPELEASSQC